jgi:hypothetical protein
MDRYARQRLLAAVGDAGQARIARTRYRVASDASLAAQIEREYLARAGAELFETADGSGAPFRHAAAFENAVARDFAEGAWRALCHIRSALENES